MAKPTALLAACRRIEAAINARTRTGTGNHNRRAALRRELLGWATASYAGSTFPRLTALRGLPWKGWDADLWWPGVRLALAVRLRWLDGVGVKKACSETGASPSELAFVERLSRDLAVGRDELCKAQNPEVQTLLSAHREKMQVHLGARALEEILLAAAEAYEVAAGRGRRFTEVFGLCFGSHRQGVAAGRSINYEYHVNVERVVTQLRARATPSSVEPNWRSFDSHLRVSSRFFPHLEVVGDYHSHPYRSFVELSRVQGWHYSGADEASLEYFVERVAKDGSRPRVSLVVAVATGGKKGRGPFKRRSNVVQLSVGDLFFVVGAYRIRLDATYDDSLVLNLPATVQ